jgi:3-oxoacyl-[acyl-carrier protein] reductase
MRLNGKTAIITGAASGFGRASAFLFAREGARLLVADINEASVKETAATINSNGGEAFHIHADVKDAVQVERMVTMALDKLGKIDILFNNAGTGQKTTEVEDIDESEWDNIYAVNVKSIFLAVKYVVPLMKRQGAGVIINTASSTGNRPPTNICAYASSKGAVITLTKALANELAPYNIRVNCISPTIADTPLVHNMYSNEFIEQMKEVIPLGRLATSEDVAYAALYLASDESSMVTGTSINPDGGRSI